jgi:hypothetical protein
VCSACVSAHAELSYGGACNDQTVLDPKEKHSLIRLLRAHLSEPELNLLFWSGLSEYAIKFRPLIDEYDLLQNFLYTGVAADEIRNYPMTYQRRLAAGSSA